MSQPASPGPRPPVEEPRLARIPFGPSLWLVPIRHHSPACAKQLQTLIRRVRPQRLLIEGPADATPLIPHLGAKDARPPLALYGYAVSAPSDGGDPVRQRAFFPLADFSPEWVAIREGLKLSTDVRFIDLPFDARLPAPSGPLEPDPVERTLAGDRLLQQAWASSRAVAHSGCRDFNEWWDRTFESQIRAGDPERFFRRLLLWCLLLRPEDDHGDPETAAREHAMAQEIRSAAASGERCLVVAGGYHCEGLARLVALPAGNPASRQPAEPARGGERGLYLVPYSLSRLDSANGYAAGIVDSGYYAQLWRQRAQAPPHQAAIRACAARVGRRLRERGHLITVPDLLETSLLAHRLGALRGCPPGRSELLDAMETAYSKELKPDPAAWRRLLRGLAAEERIGRAPESYPAAPLVEDFRARCKGFKLAYGAAGERIRQLDIYRSARHREVSRFLQQLRFLRVPYAEHEAGPDFVSGTQLDRVREEWRVRWRPETDGVLTELSHYGAQVREASAARLSERLDAGDDVASLLIAALQMGLREHLGRLLERLSTWLGQEGDLVALVAGLSRIQLARTARHLTDAQDAQPLDAVLAVGFRYACRRLSWLGELAPERDQACAEALGTLSSLARGDAPWLDLPLLTSTLTAVVERSPAPILTGRAAGILIARGIWSTTQGRASIEQALRQGELAPSWLGGYLQGFLPAARALLLQETALIASLSRVLLSWDEAQLMRVLPHLRLAFTALRPREAANLGECIGRLIEGEPQGPQTPWGSHERQAARDLYDRARSILHAWGFSDAE